MVVDDKERTWQVLGAALSADDIAGGAGSLTAAPMEEWQRLPKDMLLKYCQKEKWSGKPQYQVLHGTGSGGATQGKAYICRVKLVNSKKRELVFPSNLSGPTKPIAEQYAALCALGNLTPAAPRDKLLPEPYRAAWLKFQTQPPPKLLEKKQEANPDARDRSVSHKNSYQAVSMSEANRLYVESVIKRCQSQRGESVSTSSSSATPSDKSSGGSEEEREALVGMRWPLGAINRAIAACPANAGVPELLDWLCLNTPEAELPSGFAAQMKPKIEVFDFKRAAAAEAEAAAREPEPEPGDSAAADSSAAEVTLACKEWLQASGPAFAGGGQWWLPAGDAAMGSDFDTTQQLHTVACGTNAGVVEDGGKGEPVTDEEFDEEFATLEAIFGVSCLFCTYNLTVLTVAFTYWGPT